MYRPDSARPSAILRRTASDRAARKPPAARALDGLRRVGQAPLWGRLWNRLFSPADIASLVVFRIAFGALMLWEVWNYYENGWIQSTYIDPTFNFTYYGFGWVQPWPQTIMYLHFAALAVLAFCLMIGLMYRLSAALFFLGFSYVFLVEQSYYVNHFYFICLLSFLLIFVPAHRYFSLDAALRPGLRSQTVPTWTLWLLLFQIGVVYFFGGLAKINGDWLRGEPIRMWLADDTGFPLIGRFFTEEWAAYLFAYGGLSLDLLVVPLLLWRRTRVFAFVGAVTFHLMNSQLFHIGVFPWFMIAATTLFFSASWPRRALGLQFPTLRGSTRDTSNRLHSWQRAVVALLCVYVAIQILVPLRHHLYPGSVSWTEEGHNFAWNMMLRSKQAEAEFIVADPSTGETWELDVDNHLTDWQEDAMVSRPYLILQLAHHVSGVWAEEGYENVEVRADVQASLNGRDYQPLVDPDVDLADEPRRLGPTPWIEPLEEPL